MDKDIQRILLTEEQIKARIKELGEELTREYADKDPVIIGVLKGVVVFYADMIREIKVPSQKICTLLDKPERRKPGITLKADYTGFTIPNEFVVGYGLDYNEHYRNLPYVGVLKPEVYEK